MICAKNENHRCRFLEPVVIKGKMYDLYYCDGCNARYIETPDFADGQVFMWTTKKGNKYPFSNMYTARVRRKLVVGDKSFNTKEEIKEYFDTLFDLYDKRVFVGCIPADIDGRQKRKTVTAKVPVLLYGDLRLKYSVIKAVWYKEDDIYYVSMTDYFSIKRKTGHPVLSKCIVYEDSSYDSLYNEDMFDSLQEQSVLNMFGYSVAKGYSLSDAKRQKILAAIIDFKVLTKQKVISYLEFFIASRRGSGVMRDAISKWEKDIRFVEQYQSPMLINISELIDGFLG